jgi:CBS domain-containing protein
LTEPVLGRIVIETLNRGSTATAETKEAIMIVKNIFAGKRGDVVTIEPTADLTAAIKLLAEQRIGAVVILDANHRIVGILSERDIVRSLAEHGPTALNERVSQVMTRDVKTCTELAQKMTPSKT